MELFDKAIKWVDKRFPLIPLWKEHLSEYYAPKNFNFWYFFGSLALLMLCIQIITGIWLTMSYNPSELGAFDSVEYIMRDVSFGWLLRYTHSTGASFFFLVVYLHMFRSLLYGSYRKPRELLWITGVFIFILLMAESFFGYLLPWGNMSFWGAQVITSLFEAVPFIGANLVEIIRGNYNISGVILTRFFSLHVSAVPLIFVGLVVIHLLALHTVGSNNPDGIEIKNNKDINGRPLDGIPFYPYYVIKDIFAVGVFLIMFFSVVFFAPTLGGIFLEAPNFIPADSLKTPDHIAPIWYMTPFYAILRAVPNKIGGVIAMGAAIGVIFFLPWLDRSPVKSIRYKGLITKLLLILFVISFFILGYLGMVQPSPLRTLMAQICTTIYFLFFILMPFYSVIDKTKIVPERLT